MTKKAKKPIKAKKSPKISPKKLPKKSSKKSADKLPKKSAKKFTKPLPKKSAKTFSKNAKRSGKSGKAEEKKPIISLVVRRKVDPSKKPTVTFVLKSAVSVKVREVDEKPLTSSEVHKYRDTLTQKRDELLAVVQRKKEQEQQTAAEEIGDEADIATRSVEREMLFELTDSEKQTLDMVEAALRKMEKDVFGLCESCQKPIGRLRIDVMPWARYCIRCQSLQEIPAGE